MYSVQQTSSSESAISSQQDNNSASSVAPVSSSGGYMLLLFSVAVSMMLYSGRKIIFKAIWKRRGALEQVPCYRCRFFNNNPYLKCTVRPDIVLSDQAINCSDYCS